MIPKIIHYCWFSHGEMPDLVRTCIASWHRHMPDWEYRLWTEDTLLPILNPSIKGRTSNTVDNLFSKREESGDGIENNGWLEYMPAYVQEAYQAKKYAFVSDYVRLWALEREGGLYMDVDFEVYKPFDDLMIRYDAFAGYEGSKRNPVMMGVIAAKAHHPWIQGMLQTYNQRSFIKVDGSYDMTPNTGYFLDWMQKLGFVADGKEKDFKGVHILPVECFCPGLTTGENLRCERTYCEHKGLHSWSSDGGWKGMVLSVFREEWKTKLIKLKRKLLG